MVNGARKVRSLLTRPGIGLLVHTTWNIYVAVCRTAVIRVTVDWLNKHCTLDDAGATVRQRWMSGLDNSAGAKEGVTESWLHCDDISTGCQLQISAESICQLHLAWTTAVWFE